MTACEKVWLGLSVWGVSVPRMSGVVLGVSRVFGITQWHAL
jgi:hypothetical protein